MLYGAIKECEAAVYVCTAILVYVRFLHKCSHLYSIRLYFFMMRLYNLWLSLMTIPFIKVGWTIMTTVVKDDNIIENFKFPVLYSFRDFIGLFFQ